MAKAKAIKGNMAAITQAEDGNVPGPITSLPCELLTQIISSIPDQASKATVGGTQDIENVRLVCRGFRDCAWPAFGERLRHTLFDLRSIRSMTTFKNISEKTELAPFVSSLQFCIGYVSDSYPGIQPNPDWDEDFDMDDAYEFMEPLDYLDEHLLGRLSCYRHHTRVWFDDAWEWTPCSEHGSSSLQSYASKASKDNIITLLSQMLRKFENLSAVKYVSFQMPASFRELHNEIVDSMLAEDLELIKESFEDDLVGVDILGVDILLRGLAAGDTGLKSLSIPVPAMFYQSFATYTDLSVVKKVFKSVETFTIRHFNDHEFCHHLDASKAFVLSASEAPKLRVMKCEGWHTSNQYLSTKSWLTAGTSVTAAPPLHNLQIDWVASGTIDKSFFALLSNVGTTLKTLTFSMPFTLRWGEIVSFLATSEDVSLENLTVICNWPFGRYDYTEQTDFQIPSKDHVHQAAREVVLRPDSFKIFMETKWVPKAATGRSKGKARKLAKGRRK